MEKKIKKGSIVKDRYGEIHEVMQVSDNSVYLYNYNGTIHISKLFLVK